MAKDCLNHSGTPAAAHCYQCSKPVCTACVHVMPYGRFCSIECGMLYQDYQRQAKDTSGVKRSKWVTGMTAMLVIFLVGLGFLFGLHYLAEKSGNPGLKKYDFIGQVISRLKKHSSSR